MQRYSFNNGIIATERTDFMLIDEVTITVHAGNGGNGAVSFRRNEGNPRGGPDGGNGGNGGDVYVIGVDDLSALRQFQFKKVHKADDGVQGKRKNLFGRNADDLYLKLPLGTRITDDVGGIIAEVEDTKTPILIARGGKGGRGNNEFKSPTNQAPRFAEKGEKGEEKVLHLELRLIADVGLIGLPNAGKSSLLLVLTNASPKIGNYPFTTLEPNIGVMDKIILADIPGLIEGASSGKGLGIKFLKHIEKTKLLVHCIDASSEDPVASYKVVRDEFARYNDELLKKPELLVLTKRDLVTAEEIKRKEQQLKKIHKNILSVSAYDDDALVKLKAAITKAL